MYVCSMYVIMGIYVPELPKSKIPKGIYKKNVPPPSCTFRSVISPSVSASLWHWPVLGGLSNWLASNTPFELSPSLRFNFVVPFLFVVHDLLFAGGKAGVALKAPLLSNSSLSNSLLSNSLLPSSISRVLDDRNLGVWLAVGVELNPRASLIKRIAGLIAGADAQKMPTLTSMDDHVIATFTSPSKLH